VCCRAGSCRRLFEGQLSNPETAFAKVQQVLDAGLKPIIVAVHATPEQALQNTLQRFEEVGRGATIGIMATIQGGLAESLQNIRERFGDNVVLQIVDRRVFHEPKELEGWKYLSLLRSEGNHEHIRQRLRQALEHYRGTGRIDEGAYRQSLGQTYGSEDQAVDSSVGGRNESSRHERGRAPENRQEAFLNPTPAAARSIPGFPTEQEPENRRLSSEEVRRRRREEWAAQFGPGSGSQEKEKDSKADQGLGRSEENAPQPGKDPKGSRGRDDDYGM
jgi:Zeta toxin